MRLLTLGGGNDARSNEDILREKGRKKKKDQVLTRTSKFHRARSIVMEI